MHNGTAQDLQGQAGTEVYQEGGTHIKRKQGVEQCTGSHEESRGQELSLPQLYSPSFNKSICIRCTHEKKANV